MEGERWMEVLFWWMIGRMMDGVGNIVGIGYYRECSLSREV